jgi:hypothetical protein
MAHTIATPHTNPDNYWAYATPSGTPIANTTDVVIKAAAAGKRHCVASMQIYNTHATVSTLVVVKDGTTVIWTGYTKAAGAGWCEVMLGVPLRTSINAALSVACITTGSSVFVNMQGYTA